MPMYDKLTLGRKAKELGFARDAYEKMSRLTEILQFFRECFRNCVNGII